MSTIDLKKELKSLYNPSAKEVSVVDVPTMNFIMLDGQGDPNSEPFAEATQTLYAVAYAAKFALKRSGGDDYAVMPLEGRWWVEGVREVDPTTSDRNTWRWTVMIMQPPTITAPLIEATIAEVRKKKTLPLLADLRFEPFAEGRAVQIMHLGPYADEPANLERIHGYIATQGYKASGKHHEIYLSDPRKADPAKMRTVLRQPFV